MAAVRLPGERPEATDESLRELAQLAETAGATVVERVVQEREALHPRTLIGPGKAEQLRNVSRSLHANVVIFDHDLSPSQQRNLEDVIDRKIVDRSALILDIFAQRAHSKEGAIQVELAQDIYRLPRLKGRGIELSRLGAGIGTRGPGETKLEVDRRRIQKRIGTLRKELEHIRKSRLTQRKRRARASVFTLSMVGYTNAGKSTLLNALTDAHAFVEDRLFATLDSMTRRLRLPGGQAVVVSDTVGFIRNLPHQLIAAFRSTLDGIREADVLLHVIDASHPHFRDQIQAVETVLAEIGAAEKARVSVFNKMDLVGAPERERLSREFADGVFVSALKREGIGDLLRGMEAEAAKDLTRVHIFLPFDKRRLIERIYAESRVVSERQLPQGVSLIVDVPRSLLTEVEKLKLEAAQDGDDLS